MASSYTSFVRGEVNIGATTGTPLSLVVVDEFINDYRDNYILINGKTYTIGDVEDRLITLANKNGFYVTFYEDNNKLYINIDVYKGGQLFTREAASMVEDMEFEDIFVNYECVDDESFDPFRYSKLNSELVTGNKIEAMSRLRECDYNYVIKTYPTEDESVDSVVFVESCESDTNDPVNTKQCYFYGYYVDSSLLFKAINEPS